MTPSFNRVCEQAYTLKLAGVSYSMTRVGDGSREPSFAALQRHPAFEVAALHQGEALDAVAR